MKSYFLYSSIASFIGLVISIFLEPKFLIGNTIFSYLSYTLLAIGLFGAVSGIDLAELSRIRKSVFLVVTLGVIIKIVFIGSILFFITGNIVSYLLACIVAQIDPLAIAKLTENPKSKLSPKAKSLLNVWASFDDPMTVLLAFYILLPLVSANKVSFSIYFLNLGLNILFALTVYLLKKISNNPKYQMVLVILSFIISISFNLMFGIALIALFLRPDIEFFKVNFQGVVSRAVNASYYISVAILGIIVSGGANLKLGIVLGVSAFLAQILVTYVLLSDFSKTDKLTLSLSQFNGITSIILSSLIVIYYDQTFAIVSIAILTILFLYFSSNKLLESYLNKR